MYYRQMFELLLEISDEEAALKKWNNMQKELWLQLVSHKKVKEDDINKFFKFAFWFRQYVNVNDKTPSYKDAARIIK